MNYQRSNDYGEMRWVRKNTNRKLTKRFIWQHTKIKWLKKKYEDYNWWNSEAMK